MSWRDRLAERRAGNIEKGPGDSLPKLTKAPFVGFVSAPDGHSQEIAAPHGEAMRARLLALSTDGGWDAAHVHRLEADELAACHGWPVDVLRAYLLALDWDATMDAGRAPPGYTVPATCRGCGPVWLWPGAPATVTACPWCFRRKAGKAIPRPLVTCVGCASFVPDTVNPDGGMGSCQLRAGRAHWPMQRHRCPDKRPDTQVEENGHG